MSEAETPNHATAVVTFDWKDQPSPEQIQRALHKIGVEVYVTNANTQSDQYGYVFSHEGLSGAEADAAFDKYMDDLHAAGGE